MINLDIRHKDEYVILPPEGGGPHANRVAMEHWGSEFYVERSSARNVFIAFIQKGRVDITIPDGTTETIGPGRVLYLAPHSDHLMETCEEGASLIIVVLAGTRSLTMVSEIMPRAIGLSLADPGRVESLFYRLLEVGEKKGIHAPRIASALVEPLLLTIDQEYRSHSDSDDAAFTLFTRCRNYLENNWKEIASVRTVPGAMGISQPYMGRLFQKYENCTPHQFYLRQKMNYALYELQTTDTTIAQIAYDLGFSDAYSFSKAFKRILKQSPSGMRANSLPGG
jgi:AraC family transcriptional regulator, arabinose operon regulatory protein